ncbi:MAG TPA: AsmA family protein [Candidatus Saccharimonadales bacterium]|jgi:uncharacterized protein involved in outer membrane biogenesis|nr:AsmA family protein [Candidatus Saccharimonadales bacterium]
MRKKLWIAAGIVFALFILAILIVPHLIDINHYHGQIQAELQKKLGRQVSLGRMSFSVFPPSFEVDNAVVGEDPSLNTGRSFATTEKLSVHVKLWPLLVKQLQISSLELDQPRIELVRSLHGDWNFSSLGQPVGKPSPAQKAQETTSPGAPSLANLQITDGQVAITDHQAHQPRTVYDHIDLKLTNFVPGEQFNVKATVHLPGEGRQAVYLTGKGGPLQPADLLNTGFDGSLTLEQVSISGAQKFLNTQALSGVEGQVSGETKVKNSAGKITSSGSIHLDNLRVRNTNVGYPIALDYDLTSDMKSDLMQIRRGEIKLGATPVTLAGTINSKPAPAQIDLKITASNASIAEMARLASTFGVAFNQGMDVTGIVNANIQARGEMSHPAMSGQLAARDLVVKGKGIPEPVKVNAIELTLTPETIRSNDFTASTGSTSLTANVALSQYTSANSSINASLRAANAHLGEVLSIAKAYGVSAVEGIGGEGSLSFDFHAQGPLKNLDALNLSGHGKLQNASLTLPSLTKPLKIANSEFTLSQNSLAIEKVRAGIGQTNATGTLTLKNFSAPQVQFTLNADKVNVDELQQLVAAPHAGGAPPAFWGLVPTAHAAAATASEPGMLSKMTGSGVLNAGQVQYGEMLMANAHTNVSLDRGLIVLNPITSDVYGGKQNGSVSIDTRPALTVYTVNLKTDKVDANKLLSSVSSVKKMLYGMLTSNVNASFTSSSADAIARSLNGTLALNLANGKLTGLDVMHELSTVAKFTGANFNSPSKGFTSIGQLTGNFDVKNGIARTSDLKAVIDGGTLAGAGQINLANESLNMHVTAVLTKAMSQLVGGTKVGGFMSTALTNAQGEMVIPILVTGSFQRPLVAPDVEQFARMKLQNLIPTSKNVGGILQGILGGAGGQQPQATDPSGKPAADNQQQPEQNPLGDLINKALNRKKDQKKAPEKQ